MSRIKILFLCTGNSCRSQMAEGWTKHLKPDSIDAYSAGVSPSQIDPLAIKAMSEAGVDISEQYSKHVNTLSRVQFDYVITVCNNAKESCPLFSGNAKIVHFGFDDPPALAKDAATHEAAMKYYRRVRDEIREFVASLPQSLSTMA